MGMVFQNYSLFPHMNVSENIGFGLKVRGIERAERDMHVTKVIERVRLTGLEMRYPHQLSGGQQQRVAILRAIATEPKVLLLDEVTSALDPVLIAEVLSLISELKADGITMIISTHEMGFAKRIEDRVIFLSGGCINESGTPQEIFENAKSPELKSFLSALHDAGRL
jgi:polar amino acid transport system ATP-binding protein